MGAAPSPSSSINHDPLPQADQPVASSPLPAARLPFLRAPSFPFPPRPPRGSLRPRPGLGRPPPPPPPPLPATGLVLPAAAGRSGSGCPLKIRPLSAPPSGPPSSACGRTASPYPAPHRTESGRAARPASPRPAPANCLPPSQSARAAAATAAAAADGVMDCGTGAGRARALLHITDAAASPLGRGRAAAAASSRLGAGRGGATPEAAAEGWRRGCRGVGGCSALHLSGRWFRVPLGPKAITPQRGGSHSFFLADINSLKLVSSKAPSFGGPWNIPSSL